MLAFLALQPQTKLPSTPTRFPLSEPVRLPPQPGFTPPAPVTGWGRGVGGIGLSIGILWSAKSAYDAIKAVPLQLPWMPGPNVAPEIWSDPQRVNVEAHARFGNIDTARLGLLLFVREKQAVPMRRDPSHAPHDRNLMVQDDHGNWVQVPLEGQETGALILGDLWERGLHRRKPLHERAHDEQFLIEIELGRRNFQTEQPKTDTDKTWVEQYAD